MRRFRDQQAEECRISCNSELGRRKARRSEAWGTCRTEEQDEEGEEEDEGGEGGEERCLRSPGLLEFSISYHRGVKPRQGRLLGRELSFADLRQGNPTLLILQSGAESGREMEAFLTFPNRFLSSVVQSPSARMWMLRLASPGAEVMEKGCL